MENLQQYREAVSRARLAYATAQAGVGSARGGFTGAVDRVGVVESARELVQAVAAACQQDAVGGMVITVNHCLAAVFGPGAYKLRATAAAARGRTEVVLEFENNAGEVLDPLQATGGGVVDVAAFALRVAAILLTVPQPRRLLVLDEPFKFLSQGHRAAAGALLATLAEELDFQIILVTHVPELAVGAVVEIGG
jgi:DNA repair exonuclease SbcCD ATPase subunit